MIYSTTLIFLLYSIFFCSCSPIAESESNESKEDEVLKKLFKAAETGNEQMLLKLINDGADINIQDNSGWSPLCVAVWNRHDNIAKILIDKGANVNAKLKSKWTALHMAAENGHMGLLKLLVEKGADLNARTVEGWIPLQLAISMERPKAVAFLTKIKQGKILQTSESETETVTVKSNAVPDETSKNAHSAAIISEKKAYSSMIWIVLTVSLGIVFAFIVINYTIRRREQESDDSDEIECNETSNESYTRFGSNQPHSQMQRILRSFNRLGSWRH